MADMTISIHASAKKATVALAASWRAFWHFNPRFRKGSDAWLIF